MPRNISWDESVLENALILVAALLQLSEEQPEDSKEPLVVNWEGNKLRVTGYEPKQTKGKIARTSEVGTRKEYLLKLVKTTGKNLKLPKLKEASSRSQTEREQDAIQAILDCLRALEGCTGEVKNGYWKITLTLKNQAAEIETNLEVIKHKWREHPKAKKTSPPLQTTDNKIDWREICHAKLQQITRHPATERGFEVNVYVPLGLVERKQQQRRKENPASENPYELEKEVIVTTYEHDKFLESVIGSNQVRENKHIAIIGEPGAGKTTLLHKIAEYIKSESENLPIWVSLASLQGKTLEEYLLKIWLTDAIKLVKPDVDAAKLEPQLIERIRQGGVWLLLDGVDEMVVDSPMQALAKIREIPEWLKSARVVLTCRLNVWDANVNKKLIGFETYKTQEFKPSDVDKFIQDWFTCAESPEKGAALQVKLKEDRHEKIRRLVTNPLRLSLLCQTFYLDADSELPETKAALYERFTHYFYEWKPDIVPPELHQALSKLAFAGINSSTRFRLKRRLAVKQMGEKLFKLACKVGWLNLVDRDAQTEEEVYAFFHANFQEYFAALHINHWHEFLKHVPHNPTQGTYRIFEPQWKEVILLWLGREDVSKEEKSEFIQALVEFKDECKNCYGCRAYLLAAVGIAEFRACDDKLANQIVQQVVKWGYSDRHIYDVLADAARTTVQQTQRIKAIHALAQLLHQPGVSNSTRRKAAESLGEIDPGNKDAIAALVQLLHQPGVDDSFRREAAEILGQIDPGNQDAIGALVQLLTQEGVNEDTLREAAESLWQIDPGNKDAIAALVQLLTQADVAIFTRSQAAESLGKIDPGNLVKLLIQPCLDYLTRLIAAKSLGQIDPGNKDAIAALVQLLHQPGVYNYIRRTAANILVQIGAGNQNAIAALVQLFHQPGVDNSTRRKAVENLRKIGAGNQDAIAALVQLLTQPGVDEDTLREAAVSLGNIDPGNQHAIAALVQLLDQPGLYNSTRREVAESLGEIGAGNQYAIHTLVQLLHQPGVDEDTLREAAESLGQIDPGNQNAIAALVQLLHQPGVNDWTLREAAVSLGNIDPGNQHAINALVQLLHQPDVDEDTLREAAESLGQIGAGKDNALTILADVKRYYNDFPKFTEELFNLIWQCCENLPYPDFYQAWHPITPQLDLANLPQALTQEIANNPDLASTLKLICVNATKFPNPDNPAAKIYTEMYKAGCPKCEDGTPKTMADLQIYWDLLARDFPQQIALIFYEHPTTKKTQGFSNCFLEALSIFDGAICLITEQVIGDSSLQIFSPSSALLGDVVGWLSQKLSDS